MLGSKRHMLCLWKAGTLPKGVRRGQEAYKDVISSAVVATAGMMCLPQLEILVSVPECDAQYSTTAIADTGAQVCVSGLMLLRALSLLLRQLQGCAGL